MPELCRRHGVSPAAYYGWKGQYGGMEVSEPARIKTPLVVPARQTHRVVIPSPDATRERSMKEYAVEIVGWLAAALMLWAYILLTTGKINGRSSLYHWMNVLSGAGFVVNSGWNGAYPSAAINVIWMLIGLYGVFGRSASQSTD